MYISIYLCHCCWDHHTYMTGKHMLTRGRNDSFLYIYGYKNVCWLEFYTKDSYICIYIYMYIHPNMTPICIYIYMYICSYAVDTLMRLIHLCGWYTYAVDTLMRLIHLCGWYTYAVRPTLVHLYPTRIHTYIHTYIHTLWCICIPSDWIYVYIHTYIHTYIHFGAFVSH